MSTISATTPMIVETSRGPCIVGRRTTVYVIMDHIKAGLKREFIKERLSLSDEQLNAALEYIELHREEVERDYEEILCRSEERREHYERIYRERSPLDPNLPVAERLALIRRNLISKGQAAPLEDDHQDPSRP